MSVSSQPNTYAEAIKKIKEACPKGFDAPVRNYTADNPLEASTEWRSRGPITNDWYNPMNLAYLVGKSKSHKEGSLEECMEKIFKTWEMEVTNKKNLKDWKTVDHARYSVTVGHVDYKKDPSKVEWRETLCAPAAAALGNYNIMLQKCPAYKFKDVTPDNPFFEDSHDIFHDGFTSFPWEILDAERESDSVVNFTYRHWGYWAGKGLVQLVNLVGKVRAEFNPVNGKIEGLHITIDPNKFLAETVEGKPKSKDDQEFPSALAQALGKKDPHELINFFPKGKTLETL